MSVFLRFSIKNPADIDSFVLDLSSFLTTGETVTAINSVTCTPSDLTVSATSFTTTSVAATLSGGTSGTDYTVAFSFLTSAGRTITRSAMLLVGPV